MKRNDINPPPERMCRHKHRLIKGSLLFNLLDEPVNGSLTKQRQVKPHDGVHGAETPSTTGVDPLWTVILDYLNRNCHAR